MEGLEPVTNTIEKSTTNNMMTGRQAQEVQAAMVVAKKFPRDITAAITRIMTSCKRKRLAEQAEYVYPRGGTKVTGPTIRLAEAIAQNWGNVDYGIIELSQTHGNSEMMAYAWDLETNTRRTMIFNVPHKRFTKSNTYALSDPRDIYEMTANMGARRVRACLLAVIPGDVVESAVAECHKTLLSGNTEPFEDRIKKMVIAFAEQYQVSQEMLEDYAGYKVSSFSEQDIIKLKGVFQSLKDGMSKREDYFKIEKKRTPGSSSLDKPEVPEAEAKPETDRFKQFEDHIEKDYKKLLKLDGYKHSQDIPAAKQDEFYDACMLLAEEKLKISTDHVQRAADEWNVNLKTQIQPYMKSHCGTTEWNKLDIERRLLVMKQIQLIGDVR